MTEEVSSIGNRIIKCPYCGAIHDAYKEHLLHGRYTTVELFCENCEGAALMVLYDFYTKTKKE